ncbi:HAD family hydrolase [Euzebyella saccharophila]|uniref:HAD family hydrolase n=1 Tax=Euzebyella saccharophila TaxID=679664 RepID=A0ABV8JZ67_9FLAO|nr:HAD family hydrolase [Euzebyella saccharophila]
MRNFKNKIENLKDKNVLFTDFFDTLVHRKVHPNYTLKIWAKFMVRELGLTITADQLFGIRSNATEFVAKKEQKNYLEVAYEKIVTEVYLRLLHSDILNQEDFENFSALYKEADILSEIAVQFTNEELVAELYRLKTQGYTIYLVSDFYLPKAVISKIIEHHGFLDLFEDIFVSCSVDACKENGSIYDDVLQRLKVSPDKVVMVGDNMQSDVINAEKKGLTGIHLKHFSHKIRNKQNLLGKDQKSFYKACRSIEKICLKSEYAFSEFILHFYFFTERLYINARKNKIKDLFFLAREGHYLKALFDSYQELHQFPQESRISTHYLKASRQSATQLALKPIEEEEFGPLMKKFGDMSLTHFLDWFPFSDETKIKIKSELDFPADETLPKFFNSEIMAALKKNETFQKAYEKNRKIQKEAFINYLQSFGVDYEKEGITLVDVGWGGTMQEALYKYFDKEIPVTGYYVGLKEIYNIQKDTKRFGLNFSIYPNKTSSDDILMANGQLYEQLLAAPHGSTLYYANNPMSPTVERHEENEKFVYDTYIAPIQSFMFEQFEQLFHALRPIDYTQEMAQDYMTDMALKTGIFSTKRKINFVKNLSKGFYQNVGANTVGIAYDPKQLKTSKTTLLKRFLISPEKVFRYLVKVKPFLYSKGLYWASKPVDLAYYYIKLNFWVKKKWFDKGLLP